MHSGGHKSAVSFNCLVIHFYNWILLKLEVNRNVLTGKGQKSCFQKERKIKGMEEDLPPLPLGVGSPAVLTELKII